MIISIPWRPCKRELHPFGCSEMFYIGLFAVAIFISAWALTLSVRLDRQLEEPQCVEWTTGRFHALFLSQFNGFLSRKKLAPI